MDIEKNDMLNIFKDFLRIPTISAERKNLMDGATFLNKFLNSIGIKSKIIGNKDAPVVYGEYNINAEKTLLIYNHYDVQPVDPVNEWSNDPFNPVIINNRIYARGAADNKGALMSRLYGIYHAIKNDDLHVNLKFLYEGEEEIGSPSLEDFVLSNKDLLKSDGLLMEGSTIDVNGRPVIYLGVKGLLYVQLTDEIGDSDLHSSNAPVVPNPIWEIVLNLSKLYDGEKIKIPGFYDDIKQLSDKEIEILKNFPLKMEDYMKSFKLRRLKYSNDYEIVKALYTEPTFNIDGVYGGYSGPGSKTVIPRLAGIKIDFRLVPDQDPNKIFKAFEESLRSNGFTGEIKILSSEYPVRTSPDSEMAKSITKSAKTVFKLDPVVNINMPGTQPMALFTKNLGITEAASAIDPRDNKLSNWHAPNESISINNFYIAAKHMHEFLKIYHAE